MKITHEQHSHYFLIILNKCNIKKKTERSIKTSYANQYKCILCKSKSKLTGNRTMWYRFMPLLKKWEIVRLFPINLPPCSRTDRQLVETAALASPSDRLNTSPLKSQ